MHVQRRTRAAEDPEGRSTKRQRQEQHHRRRRRRRLGFSCAALLVLISLSSVAVAVVSGAAATVQDASSSSSSAIINRDATASSSRAAVTSFRKAKADDDNDAASGDAASLSSAAKAIAQRIDEALEQEFPEDKKESVGKTYTEKAKQEDATVETVVKVSAKSKADGDARRAADAAAAAAAAVAATASKTEAADDDGSDDAKTSPPPPHRTSWWPDTSSSASKRSDGADSRVDRDASSAKNKNKKQPQDENSKTKKKANDDKGESNASKKKEDGKGTAASSSSAAAAAAAASSKSSASSTPKHASSSSASSTESEVDRIIDSQDNEYILSRPGKDASSIGLTLDAQLVRDLTVLMTASAVGGGLMEALGQPQISGYFLAGSVVGPGGLAAVVEVVQVESLAQLGVQFMMFSLGLEFNPSKIRAVRGVALLGGALQIGAFAGIAGLAAKFIGASSALGAFVGALVAMSSTSVVVKCLADDRSQAASSHGQIAVGTLILQDCTVGLLFALMPAAAAAARATSAGGSKADGDGGARAAASLAASTLGSLALVLFVALVAARLVLPRVARAIGGGGGGSRRVGGGAVVGATISNGSNGGNGASAELYQLAVLSLCLLAGAGSAKAGLSTELGAFAAGVALSSTDARERAAAALEPVKSLFLALFISSTGLVMSPSFLLAHARVLAGCVLLTVAAKAAVFGAVVRAFGFPARVALAVGLSLGQIGELAFVLLSSASQIGLVQFKLYQLLMGTTALSLLATPFLVRAAAIVSGELDDRRHHHHHAGIKGGSVSPSPPNADKSSGAQGLAAAILGGVGSNPPSAGKRLRRPPSVAQGDDGDVGDDGRDRSPSSPDAEAGRAGGGNHHANGSGSTAVLSGIAANGDGASPPRVGGVVGGGGNGSAETRRLLQRHAQGGGG